MSASAARMQRRAQKSKTPGERIAELEARMVNMDVAIYTHGRATLASRILAHAVADTAGISTSDLITKMYEIAQTLDPVLRPDEHLADIERALNRMSAGATPKTEAPT